MCDNNSVWVKWMKTKYLKQRNFWYVIEDQQQLLGVERNAEAKAYGSTLGLEETGKDGCS